jgi:hypothetical protein
MYLKAEKIDPNRQHVVDIPPPPPVLTRHKKTYGGHCNSKSSHYYLALFMIRKK